MTKLSALWLVLCSPLLILGPVPAQGSDPAVGAPSCSTVITSCGCVITNADTYTVANDLSADQTGRPNCIEIAAPGSILNVKGFAILGFGNGTGIGILIRQSANHAIVEGGDEGSDAAPNDAGTKGRDFPGAQGVVTQWDVAIEDDADDSVIELFKNLGGSIFQQHDGNATSGVLIKGAKHVTAADFLASYNGKAGVIVRNSTAIKIFNVSTISNVETGIWLDSSDDSTIGTASAAANGKYGIWLRQSSGNTVVDANGTSGNGNTGILIGCGNSVCTGNQGSDNNRITNSGAPGNQMAGIVIKKHSQGNIVTVTHNDGNPQNQDMVDLNSNCGTNVWYNNTGTSNQNCIH
jgi:parallel beta-helix repeat protein